VGGFRHGLVRSLWVVLVGVLRSVGGSLVEAGVVGGSLFLVAGVVDELGGVFPGRGASLGLFGRCPIVRDAPVVVKGFVWKGGGGGGKMVLSRGFGFGWLLCWGFGGLRFVFVWFVCWVVESGCGFLCLWVVGESVVVWGWCVGGFVRVGCLFLPHSALAPRGAVQRLSQSIDLTKVRTIEKKTVGRKQLYLRGWQ